MLKVDLYIGLFPAGVGIFFWNVAYQISSAVKNRSEGVNARHIIGLEFFASREATLKSNRISNVVMQHKGRILRDQSIE